MVGAEDHEAGQERRRLIRKVLVANRGEIACRVMRTCRDMGIATVAVFSNADATARHVAEADEAVLLGGSTAAESYLNADALLEAARRSGVDAIHPGYGFLAENAEFAAACRKARLIFIGPAPEVIGRMGSKREARRMMAAAGVPVAPGYDGEDQSDERFQEEAELLGYPVMVKASSGGGGKGMRAVERPNTLVEALAAARREALAAFGDATLLLEKVIVEPRHIEFQIFGDEQGHIIHLGERECSIQRRHQKVIEETPSTALTPDLRARMGEAAVTVGRQLDYSNAGTVEFMLDQQGHFYFLEVNTRLQVEHPVTELVTGIDLVRWQILVAEGRPLPMQQHEVVFQGHAVEARLYAEDPANGFLPATGRLALWREPCGAGVRVDAGVRTDDDVSVYYDPLLAKMCAHGADRAEALRRLDHALATTALLGVRNNLSFLRRVLLHPAHVAGAISTAFIEQHQHDLLAPDGGVADLRTAALLAALARQGRRPDAHTWRNNRNRPMIERFAPLERAPAGGYAPRETPIEVRLTPCGGDAYSAVIADGDDETAFQARLLVCDGPDLWLDLDGHRRHALATEAGGHEWWVLLGGVARVLQWRSPLPEPEAGARGEASLAAPMPGQVVAVLVEEGQAVRAGDTLLILEAMKMEHPIRAPYDGTVGALYFRQGEQAPAAAVLLEVHPTAE